MLSLARPPAARPRPIGCSGQAGPFSPHVDSLELVLRSVRVQKVRGIDLNVGEAKGAGAQAAVARAHVGVVGDSHPDHRNLCAGRRERQGCRRAQ